MSPKLGAPRRATCLVSLTVIALALFCGSAAAASETPGETFLASASASGEPAEAGAAHASISADGQLVAFVSGSENVGPEATAWPQAYVKDLETGAVTLASRGEGAAGPPADEAGTGGIESAILAADGRYLVFQSGADNLVAEVGPSPTPVAHVYRRDLATGETTLVDRADGAAGEIVPLGATVLAVSADGTLVAFADTAKELEDPTAAHGEGEETIYVRDLATGATTEIAAEGAEEAAFSADDRYLLFTSAAPTLPGSTGIYEAWRRDLQTGETLLVSRADPTPTAPEGEPADGEAYEAVFVGSSDCEVAFLGAETTNMTSAGEDPRFGVYLRDFCASPATTTLVSIEEGGEPFEAAFRPSTTADGQVAFVGQTNFFTDPSRLYLRDLSGGQTTLLSRATGAEGEETDRELVEHAGEPGGIIAASGCRGIFTTDAGGLLEGEEEGLTLVAPQTFVRQVAPCKSTPPEAGGEEPEAGPGERPAEAAASGPAAGASAPSPARTLRVAALDRRHLRLTFDGAGRARIRLQKQARGGGWKRVKSLYVEASAAEVVRLDLPCVGAGRYRLKLRLQGDPDNPTLTRLLAAGP
jgi:Tol biopolymer transport system component